MVCKYCKNELCDECAKYGIYVCDRCYNVVHYNFNDPIISNCEITLLCVWYYKLSNTLCLDSFKQIFKCVKKFYKPCKINRNVSLKYFNRNASREIYCDHCVNNDACPTCLRFVKKQKNDFSRLINYHSNGFNY